MNQLQFRMRIRKARKELKWQWREDRYTWGLCNTLDKRVHPDTYSLFNSLFRAQSPYPDEMYWLGKIESKEGYNNRLEYLEKFKKHCLRTKEYRKWKV